MKKSILTLAIAIATVLGISQSAFAGTKDRDAVTVLTEISNINKIEVHGNVELYLSDGAADQVKVYNKYYSENALVQNQNGVLKISSYKAEKLVVWVTVSDLFSLSVYDNAQVKSFGKLSALELNLNLYNNASAQLNLDAYAVNVKLNDRAKADIEGTTTEANLACDYSAFLNISNLNSEHLVKKVVADPYTGESNPTVAL
ncbi:DUF2807 domain-containing protein [Mucilaginibacter sp. BT774]|uniref:GIN domain-containing protein n=1 Tax=Mucilaginibacter sp. BT774 TaxID=3062276 RepID=UPI002675E57C|nr:DUF2807 domain-containing protein [Mucilaginibacter sp. BT774]MDO3628684.1 DUF2807 domain-containing protein [Mucilaginibacter sp. BT774]